MSGRGVRCTTDRTGTQPDRINRICPSGKRVHCGSPHPRPATAGCQGARETVAPRSTSRSSPGGSTARHRATKSLNGDREDGVVVRSAQALSRRARGGQPTRCPARRPWSPRARAHACPEVDDHRVERTEPISDLTQPRSIQRVPRDVDPQRPRGAGDTGCCAIVFAMNARGVGPMRLSHGVPRCLDPRVEVEVPSLSRAAHLLVRGP